MQWCGLLVYTEQAETSVVPTRFKKTEVIPVRTAAGEAPPTECPLNTTLPQSLRQPNPQTPRPTQNAENEQITIFKHLGFQINWLDHNNSRLSNKAALLQS